ncbi:tetratricopeptide repeat protein [Thalassoroseus pseudoceratinae]|uniref:tetratricopeptide repeat protein n=1 Tax=Thalassoroseus pseudoceratinae TaxID=2713176 RepID=UPI0014243056|nr:tetratricopeptide repeat protein [Thalassoroseus pseudoceratinae]
MNETLQLRFTPQSQREASAWFVPGADASAWLAEMVAWGVPSSAIRVRIVPRSRTDRTPIGVLASVLSSTLPRVSFRCHAYGEIAGKLYVPVEAELLPQMTDAELQGHWPSDTEFVWHPQAGLVAFDPGDRLTLADLLQPPSETNADWSGADPGVSYSSRLNTVEVVRPLDVGSFMQESRGDIGTQSKSLDQLPPSDNERSAGMVQRTSNYLMRPLASFAKWIADQIPATAGQATMWNWLEAWASHVLSPEWQDKRQKELSRLMQMLQSDPDQGLRYALPIGGDAPRGVAPPSRRLGERNVDFRLSGGGGPGDVWDVSATMQQQLMARYRELADREIRQGRHRRAAYIYAELLGNWALAAATLRSGGYFREAAVVYEERLGNSVDAAACYEEGGHWNEAIAIYKRLGNMEAVGRIYRRLEQHDAADHAYIEAASFYHQNHDYLRSAKLFETELGDPDMALYVLQDGWLSSVQARECLKETFCLLGRTGNHANAAKWIKELQEQVMPTEPTVWLATVLSDAANNYPQETIRELAANATRSVVSRKLMGSRSNHFLPDRRLLQAIEKLVPSDRLLSRDCHRYLQIQETQQSTKRRITKPNSRVVRTRWKEFLPGVDWIDAQATNHGFYALGRQAGRIGTSYTGWEVLDSRPYRQNWNRQHWNRQNWNRQNWNRQNWNRQNWNRQNWNRQNWTDIAKDPNRPILLAVARNEKSNVWLHVIGFDGGRPLGSRVYDRAVPSAPPWATATTIAIAQTAHGESVSLSETDFGYELVRFSPDGTPIKSHSIPVVEMTPVPDLDDWEDLHPAGIPRHARKEAAFFGMGDFVLQTSPNGGIIWHRFEEMVTSLSGSTPNSRLRLAVSLANGGMVMWPDITRRQVFGETLRAPQTTFTLSGHLVAADESRIEVYTTNRSQLKRIAILDSLAHPVAVMPVRTNEFAILDRQSNLSLYEINQ